jgi:hypothetical protein
MLVVEFVRVLRYCVRSVLAVVSMLSRLWKLCLVKNELIEEEFQPFRASSQSTYTHKQGQPILNPRKV